MRLPVNTTWPLPKERPAATVLRDWAFAKAFLAVLRSGHVRLASPVGTEAWHRLARQAGEQAGE